MATRPIRSGEVIFRESPLILGPKTASVPVCLGCHRNLDSVTTGYAKVRLMIVVKFDVTLNFHLFYRNTTTASTAAGRCAVQVAKRAVTIEKNANFLLPKATDHKFTLMSSIPARNIPRTAQ